MAAALAWVEAGEPTQVLRALPSARAPRTDQPTRWAGAVPPPPPRATATGLARSAALPWSALLITSLLVVLGIGGLLVLASRGDNSGGSPTQMEDPSEGGALPVVSFPSPTPTPSRTPTETSLIDQYVAGRPLPAIAIRRLVEGAEKEEIKGKDLDGAFDPVHLDSFPVGRIPEDSVLIFSRSSGFGSGTARFKVGPHSRDTIFIVIEAMDHGDGEPTPLQILLNDQDRMGRAKPLLQPEARER
jgi:hypothetical protein